MDLDLLDRTLADAGEPAFRARQAWRWTAGGAAGYDEMTDLPAGLRERLAGGGAVLDARRSPTRRTRATARSRRSSTPTTGARSRRC